MGALRRAGETRGESTHLASRCRSRTSPMCERVTSRTLRTPARPAPRARSVGSTTAAPCLPYAARQTPGALAFHATRTPCGSCSPNLPSGCEQRGACRQVWRRGARGRTSRSSESSPGNEAPCSPNLCRDWTADRARCARGTARARAAGTGCVPFPAPAGPLPPSRETPCCGDARFGGFTLRTDLLGG
eukprot:scaffold28198_cov71-Phaeocystis_antarctica.AAC.6